MKKYPTYPYLVVHTHGGDKIHSGWEYAEDAKEAIKDAQDGTGIPLKVMTLAAWNRKWPHADPRDPHWWFSNAEWMLLVEAHRRVRNPSDDTYLPYTPSRRSIELKKPGRAIVWHNKLPMAVNGATDGKGKYTGWFKGRKVTGKLVASPKGIYYFFADNQADKEYLESFRKTKNPKGYPNSATKGNICYGLVKASRIDSLKKIGKEPGPGDVVKWYLSREKALDYSDKQYDKEGAILIVRQFDIKHYPGWIPEKNPSGKKQRARGTRKFDYALDYAKGQQSSYLSPNNQAAHALKTTEAARKLIKSAKKHGDWESVQDYFDLHDMGMVRARKSRRDPNFHKLPNPSGKKQRARGTRDFGYTRFPTAEYLDWAGEYRKDVKKGQPRGKFWHAQMLRFAKQSERGKLPNPSNPLLYIYVGSPGKPIQFWELTSEYRSAKAAHTAMTAKKPGKVIVVFTEEQYAKQKRVKKGR